MAATRQSTGKSAPSKTTIPTTTKTKTKTKTTATKKSTSKGQVSKPGAKATTAGRVEKRKAPTKRGRKPTLTDKVKGAAKKLTGIVEGKPGKKGVGTKMMRGERGKQL